MLSFGAVSVQSAQGPALTLQPAERRGDWQTRYVKEFDSGKTLGQVSQADNAATDVRFYNGKGGFCAIVSTDDLTYIALPGSRIELPDTRLTLPGAPIVGSAQKASSSGFSGQPQQVTKQAMILGAGLATRFEPVSGDTTGLPKPGVPLAGGDSVIVMLAKHLARHGIEKIIVNTYYMPDRLKEQLIGKVPGLTFEFIDEAEPSGTAGGLVKALQTGAVDRGQPILVMQGDAVTDADLSLLLNAHRQNKARVTLGVQPVSDEDVSKVAIVRTDRSGADGESGVVSAYQEKPTLAEAGDSRLGSIGFYVLSPEVFSVFERQGKRQFGKGRIFDYACDFFPRMLKTGRKIWAQRVPGYWSDIGRPDQYLAVVRDIAAGKVNIPLPPKVAEFFDNGIAYWPGTRKKAAQSGARLQGNIVVAGKPGTGA